MIHARHVCGLQSIIKRCIFASIVRRSQCRPGDNQCRNSASPPSTKLPTIQMLQAQQIRRAQYRQPRPLQRFAAPDQRLTSQTRQRRSC
jgi:hypothetical protein